MRPCSCNWVNVSVIRNTNDKLRLVNVVRQLKALSWAFVYEVSF